MGKDSPAPPDYKGAAAEQAGASKELNTQQTWANRPNLSTPWGQQIWNASQGIDPSTGQPITKWDSSITLSPQQQAALDSQMNVQTGRSQAAEQMLGRATSALGQPLDYSGITAGGDPIDLSDGGWRQKAQDAALAFNKPLQEERQAGLESQLANMGLTRGSEAWNREMRNLQDQNNRDNLAVFDTSRQEAKLMGDQALQAGAFNQTLRQQQIAEMMSRRQAPLNELNALLTGQQVNNPSMPSFTAAGKSDAPNVLGAAGSQYQSAMDAYNVDSANTTGALAGLASIASMFMMSDERLKTDKILLGTLRNGVKLWTYRFIGSPLREVGVLAQQVATIMPWAVRTGSDGWMRVNYSQILEN